MKRQMPEAEESESEEDLPDISSIRVRGRESDSQVLVEGSAYPLLLVVRMRAERQEQQSVLKKEIAELDQYISSAMAKAEVETGMAAQFRVTLCHGRNVQLSKEKLIEYGVSVKTIKKATIVHEYTYPRVTDTSKSGAGSSDGEE